MRFCRRGTFRSRRRGWAIGVVAFLAIVGSCSDKETTTTAPVAAPASSSPYVAPVAAPATSPAPAGVAVTRVIDGDTVEIAGGQGVRVFGIDSCARLADLRERDYGGRDCSEPESTPSTTEYDVDVDVDDDVNLPDGALTGGYCARKRWC